MNVMSATFLVLSMTAYASLYERYSLLFYLLKSMTVNSWHVFSWCLLYSLHHSVGELLTVTANTVPYQTKKNHIFTNPFHVYDDSCCCEDSTSPWVKQRHSPAGIYLGMEWLRLAHECILFFQCQNQM